ncbi:MAG TPA: N-6 DNA methylase [Bacteroidales bacterium]|nr:N-6 DNA methylase [Bacteroidales bacterium]
MSPKKEYGDFQTPESLAIRVVKLVDSFVAVPEIVIEPTVGLGSFLKASAEQWGKSTDYFGYEINKSYVDIASENLRHYGVQIFHRDFFNEDWACHLSKGSKRRILVIGNPPWVTNSDLGLLGSKNLPEKSNFQGLRGFDARTGKSNFDIAEWMLIRLIEALPSEGSIAMLCKTMTARKVLRYFWKMNEGRENTLLFNINAKEEFNVAVDACLFFTTGKRSNDRIATIYSDLDTSSSSTKFGFVDGDLVSNIEDYQLHKKLDGGSSNYIWRSGIKHDASKVMEFTLEGKKLINGFGETVDIEEDYVYPLLKSSDLGNGRIVIRRAVLVTQCHTGDDTEEIKHKARKTWHYLMSYKDILDSRKSSIYNDRPKFSVFGVGPYSFSPWKIAISGLYKNISFVVVPPSNGRPVMVDDTCYSIPCQSQDEAELIFRLLSSNASLGFLGSLIFTDSKRPITIDILRRISIVNIAKELGNLHELEKFTTRDQLKGSEAQLLLLMEPKKKYKNSRIGV